MSVVVSSVKPQHPTLNAQIQRYKIRQRVRSEVRLGERGSDISVPYFIVVRDEAVLASGQDECSRQRHLWLN